MMPESRRDEHRWSTRVMLRGDKPGSREGDRPNIRELMHGVQLGSVLVYSLNGNNMA